MAQVTLQNCSTHHSSTKLSTEHAKEKKTGEKEEKARGDRSSVHFGVQVVLQLSGEMGEGGVSAVRSRARRPTATLRVYARGREREAPTSTATSTASINSNEILMERSILLDDWKALCALIPADAAGTGEAAVALDGVLPKLPRKSS